MSSFKLNGVMKVVNPTVNVTEKFSKREFVVTDTNNTYPQDIMMQLTQDKCNLLDGIYPGDNVEIDFDIKGREWESPKGEIKYFNSLEAWKVNVLSKGSAPSQAKVESSDSDLPF